MQAPAQRLNGDEKARRLLPENKEAAAELGVGKTLRCPRGSLRRQQDAAEPHRSYSPPPARGGAHSPGEGRMEGGTAAVPSPRTRGVGSAAGREPGPGQQLATRGKFLRAGFSSPNAAAPFRLGVTTACSRGERAPIAKHAFHRERSAMVWGTLCWLGGGGHSGVTKEASAVEVCP